VLCVVKQCLATFKARAEFLLQRVVYNQEYGRALQFFRHKDSVIFIVSLANAPSGILL
jgi:hypothetical protein